MRDFCVRIGNSVPWLLFATALLLLTSCNLPSPTGTTVNAAELESWVMDEWRIAQDRISQAYGLDSSLVKPTSFTFQSKQGPFDCGRVKGTQGCFRPSQRLITYGLGHEYVVRHEAGHAILWALGDSRWRGWEHDSKD